MTGDEGLKVSVHPHVRGEYGEGDPHSIHGHRFTPTCVGKTSKNARSGVMPSGSPPRAWGRHQVVPAVWRQPTVHPHVRGEDYGLREVEEVRLRFTPTCVGKTSAARLMLFPSCGSPPRAWGRRPLALRTDDLRAVHPHVRGEDDRLQLSFARVIRFTPTCVGKTILVSAPATSTNGSPPRAWGRLLQFYWMRLTISVHPHVRGEDSCMLQGAAGVWRFTPTCVGKTRRAVEPIRFARGSPPRAWGRRPVAFRHGSNPAVHPHVRGED